MLEPYYVLWQSPTPNANGHYWRIWSHGHVEVLPSGWKPGDDPYPSGSRWPTDTPEDRAKAYEGTTGLHSGLCGYPLWDVSS